MNQPTTEQYNQLKAENEQLKKQLEAQKIATQKANARWWRFGKRGTSMVLGSRLTQSLRNIKNKTLSGKLPTSDDWIDVGAEVFYRLTRIGVFGLLIALIPILILIAQTSLLNNQNQLLINQNELLKGQNQRIDSQNNLMKNQNDLVIHQNSRIDTQNVLMYNQNRSLDFQNELFSWQNKSIGYQNELLFSQNKRIDIQNDLAGEQNTLLSSQNIRIDTQNYLITLQNDRLGYQNKLFENQNRRLDQQTYLQEAERRSSLVFLFSNIMDAVDRELREDYGNDNIRNLSPQLIGRIVSLSQRLKPYHYMKRDKLIPKELSPERGQLLVNLVESKLDTNTYNKIWKKADFSYADLEKVVLNESYLRYIKLKYANLNNAELDKVDFSHANLAFSSLVYTKLKDADFQNSNLYGTNLETSDLRKANFNNTTLDFVNMSDTHLQEASFHNAWLKYANLERARLRGVSFQNAKLIDANLKYISLPCEDDATKVELAQFSALLNNTNQQKNIETMKKYFKLSNTCLSLDWKEKYSYDIECILSLYDEKIEKRKDPISSAKYIRLIPKQNPDFDFKF